MKLINKPIPIWEPVLEDVLIFLVESYLKPVLDNFKKLYNYKSTEPVRLSTAKGIRDVDFSPSRIICRTKGLISIKRVKNIRLLVEAFS